MIASLELLQKVVDLPFATFVVASLDLLQELVDLSSSFA